jgi:hypothetical protein
VARGRRRRASGVGESTERTAEDRWSHGQYTDFETFTEYGIFDCDQHLYEPGDCYTSFIESKTRRRRCGGAVDGRWVILLGDREAAGLQLRRVLPTGVAQGMLKSIKGVKVGGSLPLD